MRKDFIIANLSHEKKAHQILDRLEESLPDYFDSEDLPGKGLPTVHYISETLNISPNYL